MGGYSVHENNPVFQLGPKYVLQSVDRITGFHNHSEHLSLDQAIKAAELEIQFNHSLRMRIVHSLTNKVEWHSDNLITHGSFDAPNVGGI